MPRYDIIQFPQKRICRPSIPQSLPIVYLSLPTLSPILSHRVLSTTANNHHLMQGSQSSSPNHLTPSYGCDHETRESSKQSRFSMTSEQRKLYLSGMYFPDRVIFEGKVDVKTKEEWDEDCPVRLTSQAFGSIPIAAINKIKYYRNSQGEKVTLKVTASFQETFFLVKKQDVAEIFSMIAWGRLATVNIFADLEEGHQGKTQGTILKKNLLKGWDKKYATVSKGKGLQLAKDQDSSPSTTIPCTNELWTRFETIKNQAYLVIKLKNTLMKEEYAVPAETSVRWLQAFCTLLLQ